MAIIVEEMRRDGFELSVGRPHIIFNKDENGNNQLMSDIVSLRLFAVGNSDSPASPEKKMQAYRVMKRIQAKPEEVDLSAEDAVLIKEIAKDTMVSGIYGQLVDVLEGD